MLTHKLSVVLPAHNEAENICLVVDRAREVLPEVAADFEIVIVDDGSKDDTGAIIDALARNDPRVIAVHHESNRGYGAALTTGFATASGHWIMFMDADRQFDIGDIHRLIPYVPTHDIVAGYRLDRRDPRYRRLYAKTFGLCVAILFGIRVRDIDCAFKIFRGDLLREMALISPGALINTEILARARQRKARITQVGVHHYPRLSGASSGGSPRVIFRAVGEVIRLWIHMRVNSRNGESDAPARFLGVEKVP